MNDEKDYEWFFSTFGNVYIVREIPDPSLTGIERCKWSFTANELYEFFKERLIAEMSKGNMGG